MSARTDRMYKEKPTIGKNEEGRPVIKKTETKGEKEASKADSGTDGMTEHDKEMVEMTHKHSKERMELHHKHEKEMMEHMHKKSKEHMEKQEGGKETGGKLIEKVEKGKKE